MGDFTLNTMVLTLALIICMLLGLSIPQLFTDEQTVELLLGIDWLLVLGAYVYNCNFTQIMQIFLLESTV